MIKFAFALLASALVATAVADETAWVRQNGRFAHFETPSTVSRKSNYMGVDSILDIYESETFSVAFDSGVPKLPTSLQAEFDRTLAVWIAQRKEQWDKSTYVENGGAIHGFAAARPPISLPYSLYFGFAIGDKGKPGRNPEAGIELDSNSMHSFAITVEFTSLDRLDDVERLLKSIQFKTE